MGTLLPNNTILADIYHVSAITIRRTIGLLNKLGVTKSLNGVGIQVIFAGDSTILYKLKALMLDDNLLTFLEALQMLAITCESVMQHTFPYFSSDSRKVISQALDIQEQKSSLVATISACMQAIVRCSPLAGIREIYGKLTLLLIKGSVLRLNETGKEPVPGWSEISRALLEGFKAKDGVRFAVAFRRLIEDNFFTTKQTLLEVGITGVDKVVAPTDFAD